jgi:hypothetical protein
MVVGESAKWRVEYAHLPLPWLSCNDATTALVRLCTLFCRRVATVSRPSHHSIRLPHMPVLPVFVVASSIK